MRLFKFLKEAISKNKLITKDPRANVPTMEHFNKFKDSIEYYLLNYYDLFTYEEKRQLINWHCEYSSTSAFARTMESISKELKSNKEFRKILFEVSLTDNKCHYYHELISYWKVTKKEIDIMIEKIQNGLNIEWFFTKALKKKILTKTQEINLANKLYQLTIQRDNDRSLSVASYAYNILLNKPRKKAKRILIETIIADCDDEPYKEYCKISGSSSKNGFTYGAKLIENKYKMDNDLYQQLINKLFIKPTIILEFFNKDILNKSQRMYFLNKLLNTNNVAIIKNILYVDRIYSNEFHLILQKICELRDINSALTVKEQYNHQLNKFPKEKEIIDSLIMCKKLLA